MLILMSVGFVVAVQVRPAYDAYGWLVWGRQAAHLSLDTNAAPSWKPLTFLFTFPYALVVGRAALWVWMVTAAAAGLAAPVFAARIAYRLSAAPAGRRYASVAAAVVAGAGVLGILGYWHFILISTADPMAVALSLAAIDCAQSRRPGWAWLALVLLCLGRPEGLPAALVYAVWAWRRVPTLRRALVAGLAAIPLLWFGIPALTSRSWHIAGSVLDASTSPLPGNKLVGVINGFVNLYELPMQIAALCGLALGVVLRLRAWLVMAAAATSWLAVEIALAYHGSGVAPRYMFEPAAVMVVLAGAGLGRALALDRRPLGAWRWVAAAAGLALIVALAPDAQLRGRLVHNGIVLGHTWARQIRRLHTLIARDGGPERILACGQPVTDVPYQSILAWELDENVIDVGWEPQVWRRLRVPIVMFEPQGAGWQIRPLGAPFPRRPVAVGASADHSATDASIVRISVRNFFGSHPAPVRASAAGCRRLFATTSVS
ncbi:MAG TPA: hypothetical protein VG325_02820 [Solirubrobacteraceae bacterium]|nr:hypothetical protein [Solirubrobacteraceae bacterium]